MRALPASSAGRQIWGQLRPTRQVRQNIFFRGQHGRQRERKLYVRALLASCAGRQIGGQLRPTKQVRRNIFFGGTTGDHESASSVCELCLPVLLAARRRAHKSIAAQVCISKRTCGPTSAPETQNRPLVDFIKKSWGATKS